MAPSRAASKRFSILILLIGLLSGTCIATAAAEQPSPSAGSDLICHPGKSCYPRVFEPTHEFQVIHDDQEIPPGLHVRLDISTGVKEAKINDPDEVNPALEGLPVDQDMVVVDPDEPGPAPQVPKGAPGYDPVGKVKEHNEDGVAFKASVDAVRAGAEDVDDALETLRDLSNDMYYGIQLMEDGDMVSALFCKMVEGPQSQQYMAASVLSGAVRNNPKAVAALSKQWPSLMAETCSPGGKPLSSRIYDFKAAHPSSPGEKASPLVAGARVSAIGPMLRDAQIRKHFLGRDGMGKVLGVLAEHGEEWEYAQFKAGRLALNYFLDEEMGAATGVWPGAVRMLTGSSCGGARDSWEEGCWLWHAAQIAERNSADGEHWSRELFERLSELAPGWERDEKTEL